MASSLTIATFNCRGLSRASKQLEVINLAKSKKVDILVLQETFIHRLGQISHFDRIFRTRSFWSYGATGSRGTAIVLMPNFDCLVIRHARDSEGRVLSVDLDCGIRIVNVYAPTRSKDQREFFATLEPYLVGPSRLILVGDFNCVFEQVDRIPHRGTPNQKDRRANVVLRELVDGLGLVDAWRVLRLVSQE